MENKIFTAGNAGSDVRSDCLVKLEPTPGKKLQIQVESRVKSMYGDSILQLSAEILNFYGIQDALVSIEDSGALPFVLAARLEAVCRLVTKTETEFLQECIPESFQTTSRDRFRFTRLYLPGNTPKLMINAGIHNPDGIILDLEDSVAPAKKSEARVLVRNALRQVNFYNAERMVRINQVPAGLDDLPWIIPHHVHVILVPKCEFPEQLEQVDKFILALCQHYQLKETPFIMPIIESALGVENAFRIAASSPHIVAMAVGLEDFTADLGVRRTAEGKESLWARQRIVNACKAAGIQAIDSVFSDVDDSDGLLNNVQESKALGFEGMGCIHPRQIPIIREGFKPLAEEIEKATRILEAFREAESKGLGVVALGSKMIDPPVVKRALKTIELAKIFHLV